jgi:FkbM family methyltransferase
MDISGLLVIDVPDFLNIPSAFMDHEFVRTHQEEFQKAYDLFEDELSRETFIAAINTKISKDLRFINPFVRLDHLYFATSEFPFSNNETLLDIGGFNGDTIKDFHQITKGKYNEIISLEPLPKIYHQLLNTIESLGITEKCTPLQIGAWHEKALLSFSNTDMDIDSKILIGAEDTIDVDTIDSILKKLGVSVSLIKMDINGAEFNALMGAEKTMQVDKPNIAVKMHVKEDFYRIPILLKKIAPEMKVYLRQRNYMSMMLVLYGTFRDINKTELN